jgi:hypothetical protein
MRKPNFFIVGAPKCATTAMDTYLRQHPDIFMAVKEASHFATDMLAPHHVHRDRAAYERIFRDARDEKVVGESSVGYMVSRVAAKQIHEYAPEARILCMVRNPVDVVASLHSQRYFNGTERRANLREVLEADKVQPGFASSCHDPRFSTVPAKYSIVVQFAEQIRRFVDYFGDDQVLVLVYDDIRADIAGVYRRVLQFLEVDPDFRPQFEIVNANKVPYSPALAHRIQTIPPWVHRTGRALGLRPLLNKARRTFNQLNRREAKRPPMDPALRAELQNEFRGEVQALSELLQRDLMHWCETGETAPAASTAT